VKELFESSWPAKSRASIFDGPAEARLFHELCGQYKGCLIAPQVSFSALVPRGQMFQILKRTLGTRVPKRLKRVANYLAKSRVDFVVYDRNGRILRVVESNGYTHRNAPRKKKDILKARILREIGIPLTAYGFCDHLEREFKK
jgi:hypothetical protein